ncbi:PAS domain-containing protein [Pseudoxanthomonas suwonensis]
MEGSILDNAPAPVAERLFCEAVLDSTPDLACLVDRSHRCVYANRAMLEAVGRPAGRCWDGTWPNWIARRCW